MILFDEEQRSTDHIGEYIYAYNIHIQTIVDQMRREYYHTIRRHGEVYKRENVYHKTNQHRTR